MQAGAEQAGDAGVETKSARTQSEEFAEGAGLPLDQARALIAEEREATRMQTLRNLASADVVQNAATTGVVEEALVATSSELNATTRPTWRPNPNGTNLITSSTSGEPCRSNTPAAGISACASMICHARVHRRIGVRAYVRACTCALGHLCARACGRSGALEK